jgi:hypothetical protein
MWSVAGTITLDREWREWSSSKKYLERIFPHPPLSDGWMEGDGWMDDVS